MQNKKAVSLIVLSITILVMAILAATAIIALEDSGIIGRSKNTTAKQNQQQEYTRLQVVKNVVLTDNLGEITVDEYIEELKAQGVIEGTVTTNEYGNKVVKTKSGLDVYIKQDGESNVKVSFESILPGLGELITADNYGDRVDYTVTAEVPMYLYDWATEEIIETKKTVTVSDWKIYYHNEDYVYLVATESIGYSALNKGTTVASLTADELALYEKFRVGNGQKYTLVDTVEGERTDNSQAIAQLIKDYASFANTEVYGTNVVGAIGGPTLELLAAGWNAKEYTPTMTLTTDTYGYKINNDYAITATSDGLYIPSDYYYWLASPSAIDAYDVMLAGYDNVDTDGHNGAYDVHPVVCLKASIPATVGTGDYDFSLVK